MSDVYIEHRDVGYVVAGTRVSLDSIVYAFPSGQSAEAIAQAFPVLNLEQVYGAITSLIGATSIDTLKAGGRTSTPRGRPRATPTRCSTRSSATRRSTLR